jgi:hypothetical protein
MSPPPTPLEVLLAAMQRKWEDGDLDGAAALARAAAPYLHPRHAALRLDQPPSPKGSPRSTAPAAPHLLTDAQLDLLLEDNGGEPEGEGDSGGGGGGGGEGGAGAP